MKYLQIAMIIILSILINFVVAQTYVGQYAVQTEDGVLTLELQENGQNVFEGILNTGGDNYYITGSIQNKQLKGIIEDEGIIFLAQLNGNNLAVTMGESDDFVNLIPETKQMFNFQRQSLQEALSPSPREEIKEGAVVINTMTLTAAQIEELQKTYGVKPQPGKYWYDSTCGLYGVIGYPAYGYMLPGHKFGTLARGASNGDTNVFINGRELPVSEWTVWSYLIGSYIQPGSYWLDDKGNAGYEGSPIPLINLYTAAQQNAYRGQGGSGDNFWTSRFSAGNYNAGNTQGYVSVPGHGPVSYGF